MAAGYERRWENRRSGGKSAGDKARDSYYGLPVIHKPHWKWLIIVYFFLGGISGASYVIGTAANIFGGKEGKRIGRVARYVSLAALLPSPVLLILDLGRPERFLNMMRVVKLRSPMSVGTWGLAVFGAFCTLSAMIQAAQDGIIRKPRGLARALRASPAPVVGTIGSIPAFFVSGYTGVLLAATAVPFWTRNYLVMGPLFVASAVSSATAAISLVLSVCRGTTHDTLRRLERLDRIALVAEVGLLVATRANLGPRLGKPIRDGGTARIYRTNVIGTGIAAPIALSVIGTRLLRLPPRLVSGASSALILAGGFALRYVMVVGGRESADDPQATFELTAAPARSAK
jgi:formate-dependent nitrite reductase membrane component NrfD